MEDVRRGGGSGAEEVRVEKDELRRLKEECEGKGMWGDGGRLGLLAFSAGRSPGRGEGDGEIRRGGNGGMGMAGSG